jgi:hypothetical protein
MGHCGPMPMHSGGIVPGSFYSVKCLSHVERHIHQKLNSVSSFLECSDVGYRKQISNVHELKRHLDIVHAIPFLSYL